MSFAKSEKSEDTKGVNSSHKWKKDIQYQGQTEKQYHQQNTTNKTRA